MKTPLLILLMLFLMLCTQAQGIEIHKIEPANWWVGMKNPELQLMVYGKNIAYTKPFIQYPGVRIRETISLENPNYLFLYLNISDTAQPGKVLIRFVQTQGEDLLYEYPLLNRNPPRRTSQLSVNGSDVMYLITPDRFANGIPGNDNTSDTFEQVNRANPDGRHGGDLKGIMNHLDYLEELGVTTLWLNPILENNQPAYSYHGYAISDFYKTDSRLGTNAEYVELIQKCHQQNLKVVMDMVFNHCGSGHWWINDLPASDWLNQWPEFTRSSFTNITISDPYRSDWDFNLHTKGWFDSNMPDLNQKNKHLAQYLIQNSIWWIEYSQIDGIRMDTYPYPDKAAMAQWVQAVLREYPNFYIVGETWEFEAASVSYWNRENNRDGYNSYLPSVSDYPLYYGMLRAFGQENKIYSLYETLAYDYLYDTPFNNKIFNGNHDQPRPFNQYNRNKDKVKLAMAFLLTTRGIPQIYYGDELLFDGPKPDGQIRVDFPGGWSEDKRNLFKVEDRTPQEQEVFEFVQTILQWRKSAKEIHQGNLTHFKPIQEEVYVYFRSLDNQSTMVILNNGEKAYPNFQLKPFDEVLKGFSQGKDIVSNKSYSNLKSINLEPNTAYIIQLSK